jgi:signal transduction histidine kinase
MSDAPHLVLGITADGRILKVAQSPDSTLVDAPDSLVDKMVQEVLPADFAARLKRHTAEALASRSPVIFDHGWHDKTLRSRFESTVVPVGGDEILAMVRPLFAATSRESADQREHKAFEEIINLNPYPMALWDGDGFFIRANKAWVDLFKLTPPPDLSMFELASVKSRNLGPMIERVRTGKTEVQPEMWFNPRELSDSFPDRWICTQVTFFSIPGADGKPEIVVTIYEDTTERRKAEAAIEKINRDRYNQLRQLAGGIAHEIYNALFPAIGVLHKMGEILGSPAPDTGRARRLVEQADRAVARAVEVTEIVTAFSRLESERKLDEVALSSLFSEVLDSQAERIQNLEVEIDLSVPDGLVLKCNRMHVFSLIHNLLVNALDALATAATRKITVRAAQEGNDVVIDFADSGPGLAEENRERIFDAFYTTKPGSGTGLGLTLARRVVELYDGHMEARSGYDGGALFRMSFSVSGSETPSPGPPLP